MSNVTNLDELIGTDHDFIYRGKTYVLPVDPSTESVFELLSLYETLLEMQAATGDGSLAGQRDELEKVLLTVKGKLSLLFQEADPAFEWPFGHRATQIVMRKVLELLGVTVNEGGDGSPPAPAPKPKPKAPPKRASSVKAKPRARTGSR